LSAPSTRLLSRRGAQAGVFIKDAEALERVEKIDALVVDKTGALTEGKPMGANTPAFPSDLARFDGGGRRIDTRAAGAAALGVTGACAAAPDAVVKAAEACCAVLAACCGGGCCLAIL